MLEKFAEGDRARLAHKREEMMAKYQKKLQAKGITSVRGRVANLVELLPGITHQQVCEAIQEAFFSHYGERVDAEVISPDNTPDLVYLDPPYAPPSDDNDYIKRYHFLEGLSELAEWVASQTAVDRVEQARAELDKRGLVA